MSATVTTLDRRIVPYIEKICKRDPFSGKVVTGGIVTARDSGWLLSWTINRQPQFRNQPKDQLVIWVYGLFSDKPGDFVKKTDARVHRQGDLHGVAVSPRRAGRTEIADLAEHSAKTVPVMMPYITAFLHAACARTTARTSCRTAPSTSPSSVSSRRPRAIRSSRPSIPSAPVWKPSTRLLDVDRGVPEVWGSTYDVRDLAERDSAALRDGRKLTDMDLGVVEKLALKELLKKVRGTDVEKLLAEHGAI